MSNEEFIKVLKQVFAAEPYEYTYVEYKSSFELVNMVCKLHGSFNNRNAADLKRGRGCPLCIKERNNKRRIEKGLQDFLNKAKKVHKTKYDYSDVVFTKKTDKVIIHCPRHGKFKQTPNNHMNGYGCPECGREKCGDVRRSNTEAFVKKATEVYGELYSYSKVTYIDQKTRVTVTCKKHGDFEVSPKHFLRKLSKCPKCRLAGSFDENKPAILYYLKVEHNGHTAYKIGITNRTVAQRYNSNDLAKITVISEVRYAVGRNAREEETRIKREFKQHKWNGSDLLSDGNTELFDRDVLECDVGVING